MAQALIGDQIINYETAGQCDFKLRTPALMLHGNGEDLHTFDKVTAPLLSSRGFVLMDSRCQGGSHPVDESVPASITYDLMADDAIALMEDELGITDYDVVGFSDGAIIALIMAMRSIRVRKLILIGVNVTPDGIKPKMIRAMQKSLRCAEQANDARAASLIRLMLEQPNITRTMLAGIICETTVAIGKNDEYIKREHSMAVADAIPRGSHVIIAGAGHDVPSERPGEVTDLIRSLL